VLIIKNIFGGVMVLNQCDSCGKVFVVNDKTSWDHSVYYFTNLNFCNECYKVLETKWDEGFHECNHDMSVFKQKKMEIAKAMCSKPNKSEGKKR